MAFDLDQLQETGRLAAERVRKLDAARKPAAVRIRVLTAPYADGRPISPEYTRDAAIALGAGLILAIAAVWVLDYLRRDPGEPDVRGAQPIIQVAYPMLQPTAASAATIAAPVAAPAGLLGGVSPRSDVTEIPTADVSALLVSASADGRLVLAMLLSGIAADELVQLRWKDVDFERDMIDLPGPSARRLRLTDALRQVLAQGSSDDSERFVLADGLGNPFDEPAIDADLACMAHDAGLRHPEAVTARTLHFTYAAFLARQGIRMSDLAALVGRLSGSLGTELMRLAPSGQARPLEQIDTIYPSFRTA